MTAEKEGRTSALAALTAEVMADKKTAAKALTPVAGEAAPRVLPSTPASFPNDMPQEVIEQKAGELTRIIDHLSEARDALLGLVEQAPPEKVVDLKAVKKAKEAEADFNADFKAKQESAQAAVFAAQQADAGGGPVEVMEAAMAAAAVMEAAMASAADEWTCPTHGKATTKRSNKTGREFIGCPDCNQFKR